MARRNPNPHNRPLKAFLEQGLCILAGLSLPLGLVWLTGCHLMPSPSYQPVVENAGPSIGASALGGPKAAASVVKAKANPETPGFLKLNHHLHIVEQGISCEDCHSVGASGRPTFPDHDTCSVCHDIDIDNPSSDCMLCHVLDPASVAAEDWMAVEVVHSPEHEGKFQFDHTPYASDAESCAKCHTEVTGSKSSTDDLRGTHDTLFPALQSLGMNTQDCQLCHTEMSGSQPPSSHMRPGFLQSHGAEYQSDPQMCMTCHAQNDCDTCHRTMEPQSHQRPEWLHSHGKLGTFNEQQCMMCHSDSSCQECHATTMPKDHTNFFRTRSHGKIAEWDRDRCMVCHKQDYCEACHIGAAPKVVSQPFHTPGADCLLCHSPASPVRPLRRHGPMPNESCLKCHQFE